MTEHSDEKYVPEYSDIVLGSMNEIMRALSNLPGEIKEINEGSGIVTLDQFRKDVEADNKIGAGIDPSFIPQMYEDYVKESKEELSYAKVELQAELNECLRLNPFSSSIDTDFGKIEFFMCQRDTEGCDFSILPYEWICHIRDMSGSPLLTIYGSSYSEAFEGSANSREMFEICDMHTHQELHMYLGYRSLLEGKIDQGNEDMEDLDELMDTILFGSPIVFVQYMKRDMSKIDMKGAGLFALKYSLSCINDHLESDGVSVVLCPEVYGYFKKGSKARALKKIHSVFDTGIYEGNTACQSVEYLKFEM
ncbi:hypothetical protein IFT69_15195 [Pseudomonas putida]|nr:hypothetical protein [Pseudomonas putida]